MKCDSFHCQRRHLPKQQKTKSIIIRSSRIEYIQVRIINSKADFSTCFREKKQIHNHTSYIYIYIVLYIQKHDKKKKWFLASPVFWKHRLEFRNQIHPLVPNARDALWAIHNHSSGCAENLMSATWVCLKIVYP